MKQSRLPSENSYSLSTESLRPTNLSKKYTSPLLTNFSTSPIRTSIVATLTASNKSYKNSPISKNSSNKWKTITILNQLLKVWTCLCAVKLEWKSSLRPEMWPIRAQEAKSQTQKTNYLPLKCTRATTSTLSRGRNRLATETSSSFHSVSTKNKKTKETNNRHNSKTQWTTATLRQAESTPKNQQKDFNQKDLKKCCLKCR